jgi:hypothetical protein
MQKRDQIQHRFEALCDEARRDYPLSLKKSEQGLTVGQVIYRRARRRGFCIVVRMDTLMKWNGGGEIEYGKPSRPAPGAARDE